MMMCVLYGIFE